MPHPFFHTATFPWHRRPLATDLHQRLYESFAQPAAIDLFYQQAGPGLTPLALGQPPHLIWKEALENLTRASRLRDLCEIVLTHPNTGPLLRDAIEAVKNAADVLTQSLLSTDIFFVDRQDFRKKVDRLVSGPSVPVLLVRGGPDCGKSWSLQLVAEVARTLGEPCVYFYQGQVATVEEILDRLFAEFGDPDGRPARGLETEQAWFGKACNRLLVAAKKNGQKCWVVVDDLAPDETGPRLDSTICEFFNRFVLEMGSPSFADWFRLVLIDYPHLSTGATGKGVPTKWLKNIWDEDRPDVTKVDADALKECALQYAARENKKMDDNQALDIAKNILAVVDAAANAPEPRLERIYNELRTRLEKL